MSPSDFYEDRIWEKIWSEIDQKTEKRIKNVKGYKASQKGVY